MSIALRLDDALVQEAETEALLQRRSIPKQIEYWAQIGRVVTRTLSNNELLALTQGLAEVRLSPLPSPPVDAEAVFAAVEQARASGGLSSEVSRAELRYEASLAHPGLLDRVSADGQRQSGRFRDGAFIPVT